MSDLKYAAPKYGKMKPASYLLIQPDTCWNCRKQKCGSI